MRRVKWMMTASGVLIGYSAIGFLVGAISWKMALYTYIGAFLLFRLARDIIRIKRDELLDQIRAAFKSEYASFYQNSLSGVQEGSQAWLDKMEEFRSVCVKKGRTWEILFDLQLAEEIDRLFSK